MAELRMLRWARVEYQPNLQHPVAPVPLGVVVEESAREWRYVLVLGREPLKPIPELQMDNAWGPFLRTVSAWVEGVARSLRDSLDLAKPDQQVVDTLAAKWHGNLYLREPENVRADAATLLETMARRLYTQHVGEKFPMLPRERREAHKRALRRPPIPWIGSQHALTTPSPARLAAH